MPDYPNDSDGDALRLVEGEGNDMSASMLIDFPVVVPDEIQAKAFAAVAAERGYRIKLYAHEDDSTWDVICSVDMVPIYEDLLHIQSELTEAAQPFGGYSDGWGTFGNRSVSEKL